MGKTKRSNRVKGRKTRKYKGGAISLIGKLINLPVYVTKKGVSLGDPQVSDIGGLFGKKIPGNATPLARANMSDTIKDHIKKFGKKYDLGSVDTALDTPASTPGTGPVLASTTPSKPSMLSNMGKGLASLTKSTGDAETKELKNLKDTAIKKLIAVKKLFEDNIKEEASRFGYKGNSDFKSYVDKLNEILVEMKKPEYLTDKTNISNFITKLETVKLVKGNKTDKSKMLYDNGKTIEDAKSVNDFITYLNETTSSA